MALDAGGEVAGNGPDTTCLCATAGNVVVLSLEAPLGLAMVWRIVSCGGLLAEPVADAWLVATDGETGFAFKGNVCQGEPDFGVVELSAAGEGVGSCC